MEYFLKIVKESFIIVMVSSLFGLFAGTILSANDSILYALPIILLILPTLNSLIGNISIILVSRLTTQLYIGSIPPKIEKSDRLKEDFLGLLITIVLSLVALLALGYGIGITIGIRVVNPFLVISVVIITILMLFCILFFVLFVNAIFLFKRGKDPNNFLIPFITSLSDFLTPVLLITFIIIFI